jgi:rhodanese-related sulfurtransferase
MSPIIFKQDRFEQTTDLEAAKAYFRQKLSYVMSPYELIKRIREEDDSIQIVDVRSRKDYEEMHIKNSISIPMSELKDNLNQLSRDKINVLYCYDQQCHASASAAVVLVENGYPAMELEGGIKVWNQKAFPVAKG